MVRSTGKDHYKTYDRKGKLCYIWNGSLNYVGPTVQKAYKRWLLDKKIDDILLGQDT